MIYIHQVSKSYGEVPALQDLSLTIPPGSIFGLLGPNGAGKTTLIRLITGFLFPDKGHVRLTAGFARHQLGYLPERPHFPRRFRIREFLLVAGQTSGLQGTVLLESIERVLQQTGLLQVAGWRIATCSKGMLQRLGVAQALLTDPPLILLDEPFSGLDPAAQAAMRYLVQGLSQSGKTIVISTHRLADVTQMCSHIAILARGRLARSGPLHEVLVPRAQVIIRVDALPDLLAAELQHQYPDILIDNTQITLPKEAMQLKSSLLQVLLNAQVDVEHVERQRATLEEVYMETVRSGAIEEIPVKDEIDQMADELLDQPLDDSEAEE